jgi:CYTH domain-containing protein
MGIEIERKYLVDKAKWEKAKTVKGKHYHQAYILTDRDKTIRVRIIEEQAFLTIKGASKGATRAEFEYEIPRADAVELIENFAVSQLEKTRFKINFAGKLWEIDEFHGKNAGLIVAEIELNSEDETFELPDWVIKEVTNDVRYFNSNLTLNPYNMW